MTEELTEKKEPKKPKKLKMDRQGMPEQDPLERAHNFYEVALGYPNDRALLEATRCLQCKKPQCMKGCPVEVDIPDFIQMVKEGDIVGAGMEAQREEQPAQDRRSGVPSGKPVRVQVHSRQERRTLRHRPPGTICGRLGRHQL